MVVGSGRSRGRARKLCLVHLKGEANTPSCCLAIPRCVSPCGTGIAPCSRKTCREEVIMKTRCLKKALLVLPTASLLCVAPGVFAGHDVEHQAEYQGLAAEHQAEH